MEILKTHLSFGGKTLFGQHESQATKTTMKFSAFLPKEAEQIDSALIWLSGLTCTEENFITKAGAQKILAGTNTMIICPDTSPRGLQIAGADDSYDFGTGAGFYLNAQTQSYKTNYNMYDYIVKDLTKLLSDEFAVTTMSLFGHSMGGHGALVIGLREQNLFQSVSAFSPIVNPMQCQWGQKAFTGYLGDDKEQWKAYDTCELLKSGKKRSDNILIEQGLADDFFASQLLTKNLEAVCTEVGQECKINYRPGYDHSYFFISTFLEDHIRFHLERLK